MGKVDRDCHHPENPGVARRGLPFWMYLVAIFLQPLLLSPVVMGAPHCDQELKSIGGELGYQWRENNSVCEGLYEAKVSASLEIVSYLAGELNFDPSVHSALSISVADSLALTSKDVSVRAVALLAGTYYRMDSTLVQPERITWLLDEVVRPSKLGSDKLGVFGWIGSDSEKIFVPLRVTHVSDTSTVEVQKLELLIRPTVDVDYISWRAWTEDNQPAGDGEIPLGARAGWPFSVVFSGGPQSVLNVEVTAKEANSEEWVPIRLRVLRSP